MNFDNLTDLVDLTLLTGIIFYGIIVFALIFNPQWKGESMKKVLLGLGGISLLYAVLGLIYLGSATADSPIELLQSMCQRLAGGLLGLGLLAIGRYQPE